MDDKNTLGDSELAAVSGGTVIYVTDRPLLCLDCGKTFLSSKSGEKIVDDGSGTLLFYKTCPYCSSTNVQAAPQPGA